MSDLLPRVLGLNDLLDINEPLLERPAPLIYFTDAQFKRALKDAVHLDRRPANPPLAAFDPWGGGGVVQSGCQSPPGQICFGRWTPAGEGRPAGVYLGCICKGLDDGKIKKTPTLRCQLYMDPSGTFQCSGDCGTPVQQCRLGYWLDPSTGRYILDCRCASLVLRQAR